MVFNKWATPGGGIRESMDRRRFLSSSASLLAGNLLVLNGLSRAFAFPGISQDFHHPIYQIALIIDDIGYSYSRTRQFLDLGIPITFSILPRLKKGRDLASEIHTRGHEIMLHQPMEPFDRAIDPGPGALYVGDAPQRITHIMEKNISNIPYAAGVNNHMGSRFTAYREGVSHALRVVKDNGLFFIDSLTSFGSVAYEIAKKRHIVSGYRNVFLDNRPDESYILSQLHVLLGFARRYGHAIGIGHPFPQTARAIARFTSTQKDFKDMLVRASEVIG
jgi:polysaccharide deacetylase 2 family uncharacterized protein YibQ